METEIQGIDTHTYTVKLQTPLGDRELRIPIDTTNKSEDAITNELINQINLQMKGQVVATKVNKPVKKLKLNSIKNSCKN